MTDYGTIKIPRDEYEKHNRNRRDMGLTWAEYLNDEAAVGYRSEDLADEIRNLRQRIDDLENELPAKVTEELQR